MPIKFTRRVLPTAGIAEGNQPVGTKPPPSVPAEETASYGSVEPDYPLPNPAPQFQDLANDKSRQAVAKVVAEAGEKVFGHPITLLDAEREREAHVERAIAASSTGIPEGLDWYGVHRNEMTVMADGYRASVGRAIDVGGLLSPRNQPVHEAEAAKSALWMAANPQAEVEISPEMSPMVGEFRPAKAAEAGPSLKKGALFVPPEDAVSPGMHLLGELSPKAAASLGNASITTGQPISRELGDVSNRSANRMFADKAIQLARGGADVTLNTLTSSPKVSSYALRTHTGSDLEAVTGTETAYNREVFRRRHLLKTGEKVYDEDTGEWTGEYLKTDPNQGVLFSASETVSYTPNDRSDETAEDVYMNMVSAKRAAEKGGNVVDPMKAMDLVEGAMQKGRGAEGALTNTVRTPDHPPHALLTKPEALHMINNHATRRAAEHFGVTSLVRGEAVFERPTAGTGIQPVVWTQARRDVGEDSDFKASSTAHMKALDVQGKQKRSDDAEIKSRQGTIEGSYHKESPELFVPKATKAGKLRLKIDKRKTLRPMTGDPK